MSVTRRAESFPPSHALGREFGSCSPIGVHGRTAIFVGASINASAAIAFTLTPGATLDVFVAGDVSASAEFHSGTPAYPPRPASG